METRTLKIEDINNKLECFGFTVIHFAPPKGSVQESDFNRLYLVQREKGPAVLVKLVDFLRIPFGRIGSVITVPATGFEAHVWRELWRRQHPKTSDDTEMAVYIYLKIVTGLQ